MMKVCLLGIFNSDTPVGSQGCFGVMSAIIHEVLTNKGIDHYNVMMFQPDNNMVPNPNMAEFQPETDLLLYVGYGNHYMIDWSTVQLKSGYKARYSICEVPLEGFDHRFYFTRSTPSNRINNARATKIIAPAYKQLYVQEPKRKQVIIDHYTGQLANWRWDSQGVFDIDWTFRISDWLECLKDDYEILRVVRFPDEEMPRLKPYEKPVLWGTYDKWLQRTAQAETFIQTHTDGYGYGVVDMVARGIRVVSPPAFLSPDLVEPFQIPIFTNERELLKLVTSPVESYWGDGIDRCTDWNDIVDLMIKQYIG